MTKCNKCGQSAPHLGDSWCLACSAVEALNGELRQAWGSLGSRSLSTDILTSAVRQARALMRLGLASAGESRAPRSGEAGSVRATSARPARELPPAPTAVPASETPREARKHLQETRQPEQYLIPSSKANPLDFGRFHCPKRSFIFCGLEAVTALCQPQ